MQYKTLDRRLDLLKMEGNGLLPSEIVKELSQKYDVTTRTVWYDFQTRQQWQPQLEQMEKALLRVLGRHNQLYRKASLGYIQAENTQSKLFAINLMRMLNKDTFSMLVTSGKIQKAPEHIDIREKVDVNITALLAKYEATVERAANRVIQKNNT